MTKTTSLIVILASAIFVASTIFLTFGGGFSNMSFYKEYKAKIINYLSKYTSKFKLSNTRKDKSSVVLEIEHENKILQSLWNPQSW